MTIERALMGTTDAGGEALYVEDVFSTYLYTGNGSTQTITNGIDLAGKGGMVWLKGRSGATDHALYDTARGATKDLVSNTTAAETTQSTGLTAFGSTGFSIGALAKLNTSAATYASWTFRKAPKFFDVVTYTGTGSARTIAHSLGSTPGMIIVKCTSSTSAWAVYHRSLNIASGGSLYLNSTGAQDLDPTNWNSTSATSSVFSVGTGATNTNGATYVAYLFAHDAGGFGAAGTDSIVSCGSFTVDGSGNASVTLGWEPQYLLTKNSSSTGDWVQFDVMRGLSLTNNVKLNPNLSDAEVSYGTAYFKPNATGFTVSGWGAGATIIYLAIRRPMKTPTSGASVFAPTTSSATAGTKVTNGFASDMQMLGYRAGDAMNFGVFDRLRGVSTTSTEIAVGLRTAQTAAEYTLTNQYANTKFWDNTGFQIDSYTSGGSTVRFNFQRAPGFFDVVCYTGNGTTQNINHNLGVKPELMFIKGRNEPYRNWIAARQGTGGYLNTNGTLDAGNTFIDLTTKSTATTFEVNSNPEIGSSYNYVAYLFASCPGVSKVGSYTGNGSSQTIDCGFAAGARFVLIKRTDSTGDWWVWDTARGISASTDPHLSLNTTAAEVTSDDSIDPDATGFIVNQLSATNINVSSASYIFLAIS